MRSRRCLRIATRAVTTALVGGLLVTPVLQARTVAPDREAAVAPVAAVTVKVRLRAAVRNLRVAAETPAGYQRSKYRLWVDSDGDCRDTRDEVLAAESKVAVHGCDVRTGRWFSYYDRRTWTSSSDVDIDHLVPLKESWDSGAKAWNADTRKRYANDLRDPRTLVAVTDNVNQSKSDRDPAQWMPQYGTCRYVQQWAAVKTRWALKVDRAEKSRLTHLAAGCRNVLLTVRKASVVKAGTSGGSTGTGDLASYAPVSTYNCPAKAPIKGNEPSMIYHPPSSPWYDQTTPEQCFATETGAKKAGFRRAIY